MSDGVKFNFGFSDILDALSATTYKEIQFVRIQVRGIIDTSILPVDALGQRRETDIRHRESDGHRLAFQGRVHPAGEIVLQLGCTSHKGKHCDQICK